MLFNSIDFFIFLPVTFFIYWFIANKGIKLQNLFLVIASYIFYGWWDWRFLSLIAFSSLVDYSVGIGLGKTDDLRKKKFWLWTSIIVNIGFLMFFKYFNFFSENLSIAFTFFGKSISDPVLLNVILPVGISFYTFFKKLIDLWVKEGIRLIFVNIPEYGPATHYENLTSFSIFRDISLDYGIPMLNYNIDRRSYINQKREYFSDWGHLNGKGSIEFSKLLSRDLIKILNQDKLVPSQ